MGGGCCAAHLDFDANNPELSFDFFNLFFKFFLLLVTFQSNLPLPWLLFPSVKYLRFWPKLKQWPSLRLVFFLKKQLSIYDSQTLPYPQDLFEFFNKMVDQFRSLKDNFSDLEKMMTKSKDASKKGQDEIAKAEKVIETIRKMLQELQKKLEEESKKIYEKVYFGTLYPRIHRHAVMYETEVSRHAVIRSPNYQKAMITMNEFRI